MHFSTCQPRPQDTAAAAARPTSSFLPHPRPLIIETRIVVATASPAASPCHGDDSHGELHPLIWLHGVLLRSLSAFVNPGEHDLKHKGSDEATREGAALGGPSFVDPMMTPYRFNSIVLGRTGMVDLGSPSPRTTNML